MKEPIDDLESSEIGKSSQELPTDSPEANGAELPKWKQFLADFNLYDAMLLVSLICVTAATIRLFLAFGQYGGFFDYPWQVQF
jgi:hypothetical protein